MAFNFTAKHGCQRIRPGVLVGTCGGRAGRGLSRSDQEKPADWERLLMLPARDQDFFWDGIDRGQLLAQKCSDCSTLRHPPMPRCRSCGSDGWEAQALSGKGRILTFIESVHPSRRDEEPRCVCLIDLDEGVRMVSNIVDPDNAVNGIAVELELTQVDGRILPLFRTVEAGR
jgi:uncharacterized OB-fold protein